MSNGLLLFLSHSGLDAEAARQLKRRVEATPAAVERGLRVWLDKDDLLVGRGWQEQLEEVIGRRATAFAVYVGSRGVVNWVEGEVRLGLSRAMISASGDGRFPFIPILAAGAEGAEALPGFVRQFQAVRDVENRPEEFQKLLSAILDDRGAGALKLESDPFFGLKAIDERRSHLFFGRETETQRLVDLLRSLSLIIVTGDSGSGKSSLVRAGLIPRWRGGAIAELKPIGGDAEDIWHVVEARPGSNPRRALGNSVFEAAKCLYPQEPEKWNAFGKWAAEGSDEEVRYGLQCGLDARRTRTLLVLDQFEELWTLTQPEQRGSFVDLLLGLVEPGSDAFAVVLTMRRDYYNLCSSFPEFYDRLEANNRGAVLMLGRMRDDDLRRVVTEPLRLAGVEESARGALAEAVLQDIGERPGDLALLQFALTEAWQYRKRYGEDLVRAYVSREVGRVEGALARAAERVFERVLLPQYSEAEIESVFIRLVRLGDTGGATRRSARRREFDDRRWNMLQLLANSEGNRLVLLVGLEYDERAEIAHEALVTQWPRFQRWLQAAASDKRTLDALLERVSTWVAADGEQARHDRLATGADREIFVKLQGARSAWLSSEEQSFVEASQARHKNEVQQQKDQQARELVAAKRLSEEQLARAKEQVERQRATRRVYWLAFVSIAAALIGAVSFIIWQAKTTTEIAQQRDTAVASSIWSLFDNHEERPNATGTLASYEVDALWQLSAAPEAVIHRFWLEISMDQSRVRRFLREPKRILRAAGFRGERLELAKRGLVERIARENDPYELRDLVRELSDLVQLPRPEETTRVADHLIAAFQQEKRPVELAALNLALEPLVTKVPADRLIGICNTALAKLLATTEPELLRALVRTIDSCSAPFRSDNSIRITEQLLRSYKEHRYTAHFMELNEALESVARWLSPEQQQHLTDTLVLVMQDMAAPLERLGACGRLLSKLRAKISVQQASLMATLLAERTAQVHDPQATYAFISALQPYIAATPLEKIAGIQESIINSLNRAESREHVNELAALLAQLFREMTTEQRAFVDALQLQPIHPPNIEPSSIEGLIFGRRQFGPEDFLAQVGSAADESNLRRVLERIDEISQPLTAPEVAAALGLILDTYLDRSRIIYNPDVAVRKLTKNVDSAVSKEALRAAVRAIKQTSEAEKLRFLARFISGLPIEINEDQKQEIRAHFLSQYSQQNGIPALRNFGEAIGALPFGLSRGQSEGLVQPLLSAYRQKLDINEARDLSILLEALGDKITTENAEQLEDAVLQALDHTFEPSKREALVDAVRVLGPLLSPSSSMKAVKILCRGVRSSDLLLLSSAMGKMSKSIEPKVGTKERRLMLELAKVYLGNSGISDVVEPWAQVFNQILNSMSEDEHAKQFVEVLKYPTAPDERGDGDGHSANSLVQGFVARFGRRDEEFSNLRDLLDWIRVRFPSVDLSSRPKRPLESDVDAACSSAT
ncbi:toll/interleukin-1 receptor domain-containing protein [Bradyrhizobium tropiciagri]|uniref:toll/interleukin-1 receptor domain-containing protein n=1 Tax=Bradyrhizobium tropiciagri TaxID=312253 RepID=UPI001BA8D04E|nr:toll/interleukin-1 receptor domain-containing protein [Bradyrhizobium tropiciagri]MBR0899584.1 toll/interleukin-1 receptor domain-containing protein [Bradyrhizobium tropiciagri]